MRGSAWVVPGVAGGIWILAVALPALSMTGAPAATAAIDADSLVSLRPWGTLWLESLGWAAVIALAAVLVGWMPGRTLGRAVAHGRFAPLAVALLIPICVPAYVVFYTWWHLWPPDSSLFAWAARHELIPLAKRATLFVALSAWSWPLVSWCVAGSAGMAGRSRDEMLALDGAGAFVRLGHHLRGDARGLGLGGLIVFLAVLGNTTCFDLADIPTIANELRARDDWGAPIGALVALSWPSVVLVCCGVGVIWWQLGRRPARSAVRPPRPSVQARVVTGVVWIASIGLPVVHLGQQLLRGADTGMFLRIYGRSLGLSLGVAGVSALLAAVVTVGAAILWLDERRWARGIGHVQALGWGIMAFVPATLVAVGLERAYALSPVWTGFTRPAVAAGTDASNASWSNVIATTPAILVLGHLARYGFIAMLLGRWIVAREPESSRALRRADGVNDLPSLWMAMRPRLVAGLAAAAAVTGVLAFGELPVTARVHPPGSDPLAVVLLNAMHYHRPQIVVSALVILLALAGGAAVVLTLAVAGARRRAATALLLLALVVSFGCERREGPGGETETPVVLGVTGRSLGQFTYPRALAVDRRSGALYVVDKTARVQRFDADGAADHEWRMPDFDNGKPVGLSVAPDGRVFVADTHYYRIIAFDETGTELMRFGAYGEGPGEFIYPTDVAFGADGRLYVAEYGGNDRVQIFSPAGEPLGSFGQRGAGDVEFDRPQGLVFSRDGTELYIADACNHRIVVVDPEGRLLRSFGQAGSRPGDLLFPYGVEVLDDGTLIVAEFGNNRAQRFTPDGQSLGVLGGGGAPIGDLRYPWDVAAWQDDQVFVLDSGNDRVLVFALNGRT